MGNHALMTWFKYQSDSIGPNLVQRFPRRPVKVSMGSVFQKVPEISLDFNFQYNLSLIEYAAYYMHQYDMAHIIIWALCTLIDIDHFPKA